jgi:hypothetical protein
LVQHLLAKWAQASSGAKARHHRTDDLRLWEGRYGMTKLTRKSSITLARVLALGTPLLLLGACAAPPPPCDACAVAARAEATANQALTIAQQALAARTTTSEVYQRSLRK